MVDWYDRQGQPIDMWRACELLEDDDYKRVAEDFIGAQGEESVRISTVWLGLNHNWHGGTPLIFETMVFGGELDMETWRYSTEEQALIGHAEVVAIVKLEVQYADNGG